MRGRLGASLVDSLVASVVLLSSASCRLLGPGSIQASRLDYNLAIAKTGQEELLLNLVRLRYRDAPYFLTVERVAATIEVGRRLGSTATVPSRGGNTFVIGPGELSFNEKPTVFYAPLEGERFVRQLLTPVTLDTLLLLCHSGWSMERVFVVLLQEMNGLKNAPSASGPTPAAAPEYRAFREAAQALRSLQKRSLVQVGRMVEGASSRMELRIAAEAADDPDARRFRELLGLDPALDRYRLAMGVGEHDDRTILVEPRAVSGALHFLSQGVDVPRRDEDAGVVTVTRDRENRAFSWTDVLAGVLRVHAGEDAPRGASVAVRYRGAWFFVKDDDLDSKSTLMLLSQLVALQSGDVKSAAPLLSFSVGS